MFLTFSINFPQGNFLILFVVVFLLRFDNLALKCVFVIKLASASLVLNTSAAKVLNSGVVIGLS